MMKDRVAEACRKIRQERMLFPEVAIILGSGLGGLADAIEHPTKIPYSQIPHFPVTSAQGHAGNLVLGFLAGVPVVAMQGRIHRYEGFSPDEVCFPLRCMHQLGAQTLIVSNASGGLNPRYISGDLVVIDQHINFLGQPSRPDYVDVTLSRNGEIYHRGLIERAHDHARRNGFALHQGTYLATLGPTYETRSEYRFFRKTGADVVGMSTVPEVLCAAEMGMRILAFSIVTNVALPDHSTSTNHLEVISWSEIAAPKLRHVVTGLLQELAGPAD
jgi:purine-nucleoside phosphorylase